MIDKLPIPELDCLSAVAQKPKGGATTPTGERKPLYEAQVTQLLKAIPAVDYQCWFEVGCALKRLCYSYETFREWSRTCPEKFDEGKCRKQWDDLPGDPRCGLPTLYRYAEKANLFVPPPQDMLPCPAGREAQIRQGAEYLYSRFDGDATIDACTDMHTRSFDHSIDMSRHESIDALEEWLIAIDGQNRYPALVGVNSYDIALKKARGKAPGDAMVGSLRYALLESDAGSIDEQWDKIIGMRLPVAAIVFSGNKSLHVICRIDAGNDTALYKSRVKRLYKYAQDHGLEVDTKCGNASRLTRFPGFIRDGKPQYVVTWAWGYPSWDSFELAEELAEAADRNSCPHSVSTPQTADPVIAEIEQTHGSLFTQRQNRVVVNQAACACYIAQKTMVHNDNNIIYKYGPATGLWRRIGEAELMQHVAGIIRSLAMERGFCPDGIANARLCRDIISFISFSDGMMPSQENRYIHVANGVLEITVDGVELKPFSPHYYSRNRTEIAYDPNATCPRFLSELMERALPRSEDVEVIQRYSGQCLLGRNLTQTFLLLTGNAGTGKGTIVNIIQKMIGIDNCTELRTRQLPGRFEVGRFIGKTLLYGPDVPSDFLYKSGAERIKSLCGGDPLAAEIKGVQEGISLKGDFNIIVTGNEKLLLKVDGDSDAWKRRLLWLCFEQPQVQCPVSGFDDMLIGAEGSGILNWMIEGAKRVLANGMPIPESMKNRIEELLQESNSVYGFIAKCVSKAAGKTIAQDWLYSNYERWCANNDWTAVSQRIFGGKASRLIMSMFGIPQAHDIPNSAGIYVRGYHGIEITMP